jgi:choline dehydrogenase-like flavoprotein
MASSVSAGRVYLPRGKTLGGSSAINAMVYIRGNPVDFDGWAEDGSLMRRSFRYMLGPRV